MKKLLFIILAVSIAISSVSCSDTADSSSNSNTNSIEERFAPCLPDQYEFVFKVTDYSGDDPFESELTMAKTEKFRYYCTDNKFDEAVFFRFIEENKYSQLVYDVETERFTEPYAKLLTGSTDGESTAEEVEKRYLSDTDKVNALSLSYSSLLTHYSGCASKLIEAGTETVAGRECTVYELDPSLMGILKNLFFVSKYYIDNEYDLCLKYVITEENKRKSFDFECVSFSTTDISIPIAE